MDSKDSSIHYQSENNVQSSRMNWLRAAVLGANDGIVSVAALIVGIAGASNSTSLILTTGVAGLVAGALSMAVGEYVSVSSQRDTEKALLLKEQYELENFPEEELEELVFLYEKKGLSKETARAVAIELTEKDAFAAHVDAELGIDPNELTSPSHAAIASAVAFTFGALIPVVAMVCSPESIRIGITFVAVFFALAITGAVSAHIGRANKTRATLRVVVGGILAMAITFGVGIAAGTTL
jgi:VIT1/CCC1 family predicted Fe2+/Mn2+ transporter